jgi:hypothetical protein
LDDEPALAASVGTVLVAAVLIAALGGDRTLETSSSDAGRPPARQPLVATVGPPPGTAVATYLADARAGMERLGETAAGRPTYAVVDLRRYRTPAQVRAVLGDVRVVRAYVRVPSRTPTIYRSLNLGGLQELEREMREAAATARETAASFTALLHALRPGGVDRPVRREYRRNLAAAEVEARALARPTTCACVFAVVVRGTFPVLVKLAGHPDVRIVDPAPPAVPLPSITVFPLQPQVTTVVPDRSPGG